MLLKNCQRNISAFPQTIAGKKLPLRASGNSSDQSGLRVNQAILLPAPSAIRKKQALSKKIADAELRDLIERIQYEYPFYGYRRVHEELEQAYKKTSFFAWLL